ARGKPPSPGKLLTDRLNKGLQKSQNARLPRGPSRAIIWGVTANGQFVDGLTVEVFIGQATRVLQDSGRVYRREDMLGLERRGPDDPHLQVLAYASGMDPGAPAALANLFVVGLQSEDAASQSLPTDKLVRALLADDTLRRLLPAIRHYARRPVYDDNFNLCGA